MTPVPWYSKVPSVAADPDPSPACNHLRWSLVLTALVFFCCTITGDLPPAPASNAPVKVEHAAAPPSLATETIPDAPRPKLEVASEVRNDFDAVSAADPGIPSIEPLKSPVKPATPESYETPRQRKIWYGLMIAGHSAAAFDAWTTRRAVGAGYGVEANPLQRPFASSGAIYATTQITPLVMDYLGHRMMRSRYSLIRKAWWVPQAASASVSFGAGLHNYNVVP